MRLLLDEMIDPRVASELRERGLDVLAAVVRPDLRALPDQSLLEYARDDERILVTRNVSDFARLHHTWPAERRIHSGIVMVSEEAFPQNRAPTGDC